MKSNLLLVVLMIAFSSNALAEIYKCKTADGRLSFSNKPCPTSTLTGDTDAHKIWSEMRGLVQDGLAVNKSLGADVTAIMACMNESKVFNAKLDEAEKKLKKLSPNTHEKMYLAMEHLRQCGECRVSAPKYCQKASIKLDEETNVLRALSNESRVVANR